MEIPKLEKMGREGWIAEINVCLGELSTPQFYTVAINQAIGFVCPDSKRITSLEQLNDLKDFHLKEILLELYRLLTLQNQVRTEKITKKITALGF